MNSTDDYRVELDVFSGPLDLLLYLVRRDELDIQDVSISRVADQYFDFVKTLQHIDPNTAGEFLVLAATLAEMKSRALLPTPPLEPMEDGDDPGRLLVAQLLEYKRFKDAALSLGRAADDRSKRYVRRPASLPRELHGVELEEVQVWDLVRAFNKVLTSIGDGPRSHNVRYDETPIEVLADEIIEIIVQEGPTRFSALFAGPMPRPLVIGRFLALLELTRQRRIRFEQPALFEEIYIFLQQQAAPEDEAPEDRAPVESEIIATVRLASDVNPQIDVAAQESSDG